MLLVTSDLLCIATLNIYITEILKSQLAPSCTVEKADIWEFLSVMLSVLSDLLSIATLHIYIFYSLAARWHGVQVHISSSWHKYKHSVWFVYLNHVPVDISHPHLYLLLPRCVLSQRPGSYIQFVPHTHILWCFYLSIASHSTFTTHTHIYVFYSLAARWHGM